MGWLKAMALQVRLCYNKYIQFALRLFYGRVAQLGERLVRNEEVAGSIPVGSTIKVELSLTKVIYLTL